jgi:hypothetical protein
LDAIGLVQRAVRLTAAVRSGDGGGKTDALRPILIWGNHSTAGRWAEKIGRLSGQPRRIEIWYFMIAGRVYLTGTPGRRDWYANLLANPRLIFHIK